MKALRNANEPVVLLTGTTSPSTTQIISEFIEAYPNVKHVVYDAISEHGAAEAYQAMYGNRAIPNYHFDKAKSSSHLELIFLETGMEDSKRDTQRAETPIIRCLTMCSLKLICP